jgi:phage-related baseplate assembly protein
MTDINFVEVDSQQLQTDLIKTFEETLGETFWPGDERRLFLLNFLPILVALKNSVNDTGRQNLLRYARGSILDAMGEFYSTPRLPAQKASVTLRFTLSAAQGSNVIIPKGTRATPDGQIFFVTTQNLIITAGNTQGTVVAESSESGQKHNDYTAGQIKLLVDPIPFVASAVNTDSSSGGSDIESDDDYRERIRQAPESFSVAGPEGAYIYWAKTADNNIVDVSVSSPSPGVVKVVPLMEGGEIPAQTILDKVLAEVSPKTRRPLTDNVQVAAPEQVSYNISLTYYISELNQSKANEIRNAIEVSDGAVQRYIQWQCEKLGRAINPDELRYRILSAGANRITLVSPSIYDAIDADQVASIGTVSITYGGIE